MLHLLVDFSIGVLLKALALVRFFLATSATKFAATCRTVSAVSRRYLILATFVAHLGNQIVDICLENVDSSVAPHLVENI